MCASNRQSSNSGCFPKGACSLEDIVKLIGGTILHLPENPACINGIGTIDLARETDIVVVQKSYYISRVLQFHPALIVISKTGDDEKFLQEFRDAQTESSAHRTALLIVEDAKFAQIQLLGFFDPRKDKRDFENYGFNKSNSNYISESAQIGQNVNILPGAVIMARAVIEDDVTLYPNVIISEDVRVGRGSTIHAGAVIREACIIGEENIIYSGAVIGTDGFGYYDYQGTRYKIPQIGIVRTGKNVEIGANVCIDRATIHETFIDDDTKIDNLVQIGHNCRIGKRCYIVSQVGISGSTTIGDEVILGGQVGVADHVSIGDRVIAFAQSGIPSDLENGEKVFGTPARPVKESHRINAALGQLPSLIKRVQALEQKKGDA